MQCHSGRLAQSLQHEAKLTCQSWYKKRMELTVVEIQCYFMLHVKNEDNTLQVCVAPPPLPLSLTCCTVCHIVFALRLTSPAPSQESTQWGTWSTVSPGGTPRCCRTRPWRPSVAPCTRSPARTWRTRRPWPTRGASRSWSTSPRVEETGVLQQRRLVPVLRTVHNADSRTRSHAGRNGSVRLCCTGCPWYWTVCVLTHTHTSVQIFKCLQKGKPSPQGRWFVCIEVLCPCGMMEQQLFSACYIFSNVPVYYTVRTHFSFTYVVLRYLLWNMK